MHKVKANSFQRTYKKNQATRATFFLSLFGKQPRFLQTVHFKRHSTAQECWSKNE